MKTLNAKGGFAYNFAFTGIPGVVLIVLGIVCLLQNGSMGELILAVTVTIMLNLLTVFSGINAYRQNSITYGNGKIIIKHVGREYVDGVAVGGWKIKEDEFLLEELESYGMSWDILGHSVEDCPGNRVSVASEAFFKLKDGRTIGYALICYTRWQANELFRYIQEETGLEFQSSKTAKKKKR